MRLARVTVGLSSSANRREKIAASTNEMLDTTRANFDAVVCQSTLSRLAGLYGSRICHIRSSEALDRRRRWHATHSQQFWKRAYVLADVARLSKQSDRLSFCRSRCRGVGGACGDRPLALA